VLDLKVIRNNVNIIRESIKKRNLKTDLDRFLELDSEISEIKKNLDKKRALRNKVSKEIPTL